MKDLLHKNCRRLIKAYKTGKLGQTNMPEDSHPKFNTEEERLAYFSLPMALNYQRDSYKLWENSLKSFEDKEIKDVFDVSKVSKMKIGELRKKLLKHKMALQPNKHVDTWQKISKTVFEKYGGFSKLFEDTSNDFLKLQQVVQKDLKKGFPYLSGPKIFNYWSFIMSTYGRQKLLNIEHVEIAPDTHITKASVLLGVISKEEADSLSKDQISARWRKKLEGSGINPIEMHPPLWFWSRNGFLFKL